MLHATMRSSRASCHVSGVVYTLIYVRIVNFGVPIRLRLRVDAPALIAPRATEGK